MPADLSLPATNLATALVASVFYGIFLVLFIVSTFFLIARQLKNSGHKSIIKAVATPTIVINTLVFISVTGVWICVSLRVFQAFILFNHGRTPLLLYADLSQVSEVVKTGFILTSILAGDLMIVYRLWVVWDYNKKIIIFPLCTLVGLLVCSVGLTYQFSQYQPGQPVFDSAAGRWITGDCVFTLCTNLYGSGLICWRIWKMNKLTKSIGGGSLISSLVIVVESAALYTTWTFFFFATYLAKSNIQFFTTDTNALVSGISFMLINVRVGLGWALKAFHTTTLATSSRHMGSMGNGQKGHISNGNTYHMRTISMPNDRDSGTEGDSITRIGIGTKGAPIADLSV